MKNPYSWLLGGALAIIAAGQVQAAQSYPAYRTEPFEMKALGSGYFLKLFQSTGNFISIEQNGQGIFITSLYVLKNSDNSEYTLCGSGLLGKERKEERFVVSHGKSYVGVDNDGWQQLGCHTSGGTLLKWVPRRDGSGGNDIRAFYTSVRVAPPPPAAPSTSTLPLAARMKIVAEFENQLSQAIGKEVIIRHLHLYTEQNGDNTTCVTGVAEGSKFRLAEAGGKIITDPSEAKWIQSGCTRPGYQLIY